MGYRRLETLSAVANKGYWVLLKCPCGHEARHNPMVLVQMILPRRGSTNLRKLGETFKCGKCGGKNFTAEHCEAPAIWEG